jgi:hypothetical protein
MTVAVSTKNRTAFRSPVLSQHQQGSNMSKISRRSIVSSAAALPALTVPAVAATEPDEIYAMIEAHRRAYDVYIETMLAADLPDEIPEAKELQEKAAAACSRERRLLWDLVTTQPDTFKGVTAVLSYLRSKERGGLAGLMDVEYIEELLLSVEYTICAHAGLPEPEVEVSNIGDDGSA